ncbi:hypothetical protein [Blastococcus sp. PRF04-17]|uniref:hypothetical protein n=1 Tax=Blastococcus sp. PRF04-17 TaxID=2933797 RepID=UPI001FF42179|nr:hypothetical protein [Blastococcus sp. PRF04-17]UOY03712.1 hypothetical protein MVA48_10435 [Blastococcus sp. PRF04-17]
MTAPEPTPLFTDEEVMAPPVGHAERFGGRWRLVGAGLSNVWRYGDLPLNAESGRLLLRGPNGTGKTTALEALWPYLLDLNAQRLNAGKARTTTLRSLMKEGATSRRRYGYLWLTFAGPGSEGRQSFGVRLQYSEGASPAVKVVPFTVPGEPLTDLRLHGPDRAALPIEQFTDHVTAAGGQVFDGEDAEEDYVTNLAARVWGAEPGQLRDLADRIRVVRNPSLLGDLTAPQAAEALREALPGVADDVVTATADALAESAATREAFARDSAAADVLAEFAATWAGHVTEVVAAAHEVASESAAEVGRAAAQTRRLTGEMQAATAEAERARTAEADLGTRLGTLRAQIEAIEQGDAYKAAGALTALEGQLTAEQAQARTTLEQLTGAVATVRDTTVSLTGHAEELAGELDERVRTAVAADSAAADDDPLATWSTRPRAVLTVGTAGADPGPLLTVDADPDRLTARAQRWSELGRTHEARAADAQLAITDFARTVRPAEDAAATAHAAAMTAEDKADAASQASTKAHAAARGAAEELLDRVAVWPVAPDGLYEPDIGTASVALVDRDTAHVTSAEGEEEFVLPSADDVADLRAAEPGRVLDEVTGWTEQVGARAARTDADLRRRQQDLRTEAEGLTADARQRRTDAEALRAGRLLPLPRPAWWTGADDATALAAAVDWAPEFTDQRARDLIETALAASGLLAATLTADGATTSAWQVRPAGATVLANLAAVLAVDDTHPLADVAVGVLERVALAPSAAATDGPTGLVIGTDGTFRAGPLFGRAPGVDDPEQLPSAQFVGAAQRRAAALARAQALEEEAAALEAAAEGLRTAAERLQRRRRDVAEHARSFPPTRLLAQRRPDGPRPHAPLRSSATSPSPPARRRCVRRSRPTPSATIGLSALESGRCRPTSTRSPASRLTPPGRPKSCRRRRTASVAGCAHDSSGCSLMWHGWTP